jgi:hypothetical protein
MYSVCVVLDLRLLTVTKNGICIRISTDLWQHYVDGKSTFNAEMWTVYRIYFLCNCAFALVSRNCALGYLISYLITELHTDWFLVYLYVAFTSSASHSS